MPTNNKGRTAAARSCRRGLTLSAVLCLLLVVATGAETAQPGTIAAAPVSPRDLGPFGSDLADGVFPRIVRHHNGEAIITAPPRRIAVLSTGQLDALLTLGIVPAGATRVEGGALYAPYLATRFPQWRVQLDAMADLGTRANQDIEAIAQLRPDLILMNNTIIKQDVYDRYARIAPTVVTRGTGVNWQVDFLLIASAVGRRQQAQAFLDRFHSDAAGFAARGQGQAPSVSFPLATAGRTRIFGIASFTGGIAEELGLARPPSQRFQQTSRDISPELIDAVDADWIFYAGRGAAVAELTAAPLWPTLSAVQAHHAVAVDIDAFYLNAGPTAAREVLDTLMSTMAR
ncbi:MAG: iron-siderophore ABC transporter substrate-binding protein [Azospirillaceae bacterium]|nr:iron-siderophore ABC transporter substrate-binding protein [Azospirillaceae bacterium]